MHEVINGCYFQWCFVIQQKTNMTGKHWCTGLKITPTETTGTDELSHGKYIWKSLEGCLQSECFLKMTLIVHDLKYSLASNTKEILYWKCGNNQTTGIYVHLPIHLQISTRHSHSCVLLFEFTISLIWIILYLSTLIQRLTL